MVRLNLVMLLLVGVHLGHGIRVFIDMTYTLTNTTIRWPGNYFKLKPDMRGKYGALDWVATNNIETSEHIGTHMDSPYHFYEKGWKINQIPFDRLHGPAVVINIESRAEWNKDAEVLVTDLQAWEERNGWIPYGAFVLMNSGWNQYWGEQLEAVGSKNDTSKLHFPGFSVEAVNWLIKYRPGIFAVGSDTVSCDPGVSTTFPVHVMLMKNNIMCVENVANLYKLPQSGAEVFAMPIKIEGTGAPIRMYAVVGHSDFPVVATGSAVITGDAWSWYVIITVVLSSITGL